MGKRCVLKREQGRERKKCSIFAARFESQGRGSPLGPTRRYWTDGVWGKKRSLGFHFFMQ